MKRDDKGRRVPRRKGNLAFDLIVAGEEIPAVITDFPLIGLGMLLKGKSDLPTECRSFE